MLAALTSALALVLPSPAQPHDAAPPLLGAQRLWDAAPHCAFGDLVTWRGQLVATWREGSGHVPGSNGKVRVAASADGSEWRSLALLEEARIDLRDPKLCVLDDGRLMLTCGGSDYDSGPGRQEMHTRVAYSADGETWTPPRRVRGIPSNNWFFRPTCHAGAVWCAAALYGSDPATGETLPGSRIVLYRSRDGMNYEAVGAPWPLPPDANETTVRFDAEDRLVAIVRGGSRSERGWLVTLAAPYTTPRVVEVSHGMGGPNLWPLADGAWLVATREYAHERPEGRSGTATVLLRVTADGSWQRLFELESGGDTSYPGLAERGGELAVLYYSSHGQGTAIYLTRLPAERLRERAAAVAPRAQQAPGPAGGGR